MKREDLALVILAVLLLLGMALTIFLGKGGSKHGYGAERAQPRNQPTALFFRGETFSPNA